MAALYDSHNSRRYLCAVFSFAAKLRQRYLLPAGAAPEDQAREAEALTAGIIYAALLHDVGKTATDMEVVTENSQRWYPWQKSLDRPYRLKYHKRRNHQLSPCSDRPAGSANPARHSA